MAAKRIQGAMKRKYAKLPLPLSLSPSSILRARCYADKSWSGWPSTHEQIERCVKQGTSKTDCIDKYLHGQQTVAAQSLAVSQSIIAAKT